MGCTMRECLDCDYADGGFRGARVCPKCGGKMTVNFDEYMDHDEHNEHEEDGDE